MMYCTSCGQSNEVGSQFCERCGARLGVPSATLQPATPPMAAAAVPAVAPAPPQPKFCPACGSELAEGAAFCTSCGTQRAPAGGSTGAPSDQPPRPAATSAPSQQGSFTFRIERWTKEDRISGIASVVLFVSLFLPWFGVSVTGVSVTASGLRSHGYLYVVLVIVILVVLYLLATAGVEKMPAEVLSRHTWIMLGAGLADLVLVVIAFVFKPTTGSGVQIGWRFGAVLGLVAAVVAAAPYALPIIRSWSDSRK